MEYKEMRPQKTKIRKKKKDKKAAAIVLGFLLCFAISIIANIYCVAKIHYLETQVGEVSLNVDKNSETTNAILNTLNDMKTEQKRV